MKNNNKKPNVAPLVLLPILIGIVTVMNVFRMPMGGTEDVVVFVMLVWIIAVIFVFLTVAKKVRNSGNSEAVRQKMKQMGFVTKEQPEHNHDRLSVSNTAQVCDEDSYTHWKKQLDDFLAAGIIERSEYNALLKRYKTEK